MPINAETLKLLRLSKGNMSQETLSERARIDRRTISRIETGEIPGDRVRSTTVKKIARALGVTVEVLAQAREDAVREEADLKEMNLRPMKILIDGHTAVSMDLVERRYGIPVYRQLDMAPLLFVLLAEMSLMERKQQLSQIEEAFRQSVAKLPRHFGGAVVAVDQYEEAIGDEARSIAAKDLFGKQLLQSDILAERPSRDPFDPEVENPFFNFLSSKADQLSQAQGETLVDFEACQPDYDGLPNRPDVLEDFLDEICAGNKWARAALECGDVRISDIPDEFWKDGKAEERGQWLEARFPEAKKAMGGFWSKGLHIDIPGDIDLSDTVLSNSKEEAGDA